MTDRTTLTERLTRAGNSSDLSVRVEARGDADYLIAAGLASNKIGRYVYQLMTEWDASAKPRPVSDTDIERIAERLPRIKTTKQGRRGARTVETLDLSAARAKLAAWMDGERRRILGRLHSLPKLMDPHAGLLPWVVARGYTSPREKLLDVLGWWADRRCMACQGTGERENRACKSCKGFGTRDIPHGLEGRAISEEIARHVDASRCNTIAGLKGIKRLKAFAAGIG